MDTDSAAAVILAAGKGTRMNSDIAKVLHPLAGKPLINWVVDAAEQAGADPVVVVVGHQADTVRSVLADHVVTVNQDEQLGTGHAVICAKPALESVGEYVYILCGDVPLIRPGTLNRMLKAAKDDGAAAMLLTFTAEDGHAYGRIVRNESGAVEKIVENKDATESERAIREANSGTYVFRTVDLLDSLDRVRNANAQGEYYLTDVIEILIDDGKRVSALLSDSALEVCGVNSLEQLQHLEDMIIGRPETTE